MFKNSDTKKINKQVKNIMKYQLYMRRKINDDYRL